MQRGGTIFWCLDSGQSFRVLLSCRSPRMAVGGGLHALAQAVLVERLTAAGAAGTGEAEEAAVEDMAAGARALIEAEAAAAAAAAAAKAQPGTAGLGRIATAEVGPPSGDPETETPNPDCKRSMPSTCCAPACLCYQPAVCMRASERAPKQTPDCSEREFCELPPEQEAALEKARAGEGRNVEHVALETEGTLELAAAEAKPAGPLRHSMCLSCALRVCPPF